MTRARQPLPWTTTGSEAPRGELFRFARRKRACADPRSMHSVIVRTSSPSGIRRRARYPAQISSAHACFGHLLVAAGAARPSAAYREMPSVPSRMRDFRDVPEDPAAVGGADRE